MAAPGGICFVVALPWPKVLRALIAFAPGKIPHLRDAGVRSTPATIGRLRPGTLPLGGDGGNNPSPYIYSEPQLHAVQRTPAERPIATSLCR
mmetsp:Transcript_120269/g.220202  ORF Transcript_120269/g.220202 Transcript_120269/m.220202 type:complete len:92 (-) Transcript_120269:81-356(-)